MATATSGNPSFVLKFWIPSCKEKMLSNLKNVSYQALLSVNDRLYSVLIILKGLIMSVGMAVIVLTILSWNSTMFHGTHSDPKHLTSFLVVPNEKSFASDWCLDFEQEYAVPLLHVFSLLPLLVHCSGTDPHPEQRVTSLSPRLETSFRSYGRWMIQSTLRSVFRKVHRPRLPFLK